MINMDNWEKVQERYIEYWAKENHFRPVIAVYAPREGYTRKTIKVPQNIDDRWLDIGYLIENSRENLAATYFGGEAFPMVYPNLGPDILGATLGCDLQFGNDTSWAEHIIEDWCNVGKLELNKEIKWWKKIKEITAAFVEDAKNGDYFVGITDLHPGVDAVVSLRGPENVCIDLLDYPDKIKEAVFDILDVFKYELDELYAMTVKYQKGSTHWMGIWHPGKWYNTSCDFCCMISNSMFHEFVIPELLEELNYLDASIFHLDGPGALKHLDTLLEIPVLKGIQWVYGAGQKSASHWIPVLKKIQEAGKLIQVNIQPEELDILMEYLKPEGVMYVTSCNSENDARDLIKKAERSYIKKLF